MSIFSVDSKDLQLRDGKACRRAGKPRIRADRQEACRRVARALLREPSAPVQVLARLAWPEIEGDYSKSMAAYQRTRRALADLCRLPDAAGHDLVPAIREALAARKAAESARRELRNRETLEKTRRQEERIARLRKQPARAILRHLLAYPEVSEEIRRVVRSIREAGRFEVADPHGVYRMFPLSSSEVTTRGHVTQYALGPTVNRPKGHGVEGRVQGELMIARRALSMLTFDVDSALAIVRTAKSLRRALQKNNAAAELTLREELKRLVEQALKTVGWADPDLPAGQLLETPERRSEREAAVWTEVRLWLKSADRTKR